MGIFIPTHAWLVEGQLASDAVSLGSGPPVPKQCCHSPSRNNVVLTCARAIPKRCPEGQLGLFSHEYVADELY